MNMPGGMSPISMRRERHLWRGAFVAMANPCELLMETTDESAARELTRIAAEEAWRIERKFSRYRDDSVVHAIHRSGGAGIVVDAETAHLIDYGKALWELSEGAFDLTSGALRRIWKFKPDAAPPTQAAVLEVLRHIGWQHVEWRPPQLRLPAGMELDFGGIGKEYAVDRVVNRLTPWPHIPVLVNFGGDLRSAGPAPAGGAWQVGIESIHARDTAGALIRLQQGALASSGDTRHALVVDGVRYGHIIDARTGWPTPQAPRSVTVAADTCSQAGSYTTLAMLQGAGAEAFLKNEGVAFWCLRDAAPMSAD